MRTRQRGLGGQQPRCVSRRLDGRQDELLVGVHRCRLDLHHSLLFVLLRHLLHHVRNDVRVRRAGEIATIRLRRRRMVGMVQSVVFAVAALRVVVLAQRRADRLGGRIRLRLRVVLVRQLRRIVVVRMVVLRVVAQRRLVLRVLVRLRLRLDFHAHLGPVDRIRIFGRHRVTGRQSGSRFRMRGARSTWNRIFVARRMPARVGGGVRQRR